MSTIHGRDVIRALFENLEGLVELRALPSRPGSRTFCATDDVTAMQQFAGAAGEGEGVYFGVATRRDATSGDLSHCHQLGALFVDLDCKDRTIDDARATLDALPVAPSIIIGSGGGLHAYWLLREPIDVQAHVDEVKTLLRRLASAVGGDMAVAEPARILRLPGTLNHKYDPPRPVTVELFTPEHRINLCDLDDWLPEMTTATTTVMAPVSLADPIPAGERNSTLYRLARSLRHKDLPAPVIHDALMAVNSTRCNPALPSDEVAAIVQNAMTQPDRDGHGLTARPAEMPGDPKIAHELRVDDEMARERARRDARRRLDAEERPVVALPDLESLRTRLARPATVTKWRIESWLPRNSRVMLAAQFKKGKTTLRDNLLRSLVDGDRWLGQADVHQVLGTVAVLDFEMGPTQLDDWLRDQSIRHDDRVVVASLRGHAASFNILDDTIRTQWATRLRDQGAVYLMIDCLRPVLDALGLDEHKDGGRFLVAFDALLMEAGITESLVVHHMGHEGERSRGDSRFRDWPDVEWRLTGNKRDEKNPDADPAGPRFLTAYGRDVDIPEGQLAYNTTTRRLTFVGGSRHDAKTRAALDAVLKVIDAVVDGSQLSGRQIKSALSESGVGRDQIDAALKFGIDHAILSVNDGQKNAKCYRRASSVRVSGSVRPVSGDTPFECPAAYIEPDTRTHINHNSVSGRSDADFVFNPRLAVAPVEEAR